MLYTQDYHLQKKLSPKEDPLCVALTGNSGISQTKGTEATTTFCHKPSSDGGALLQ